MRKRVNIALAVLLMVLAGVIGWQVYRATREREPVYQGIHVDPEVVVPALVTALHDPYAGVGIKSVGALEDFGPEAKGTVPAVLEFLKSQDDCDYRSLTTNALKKIDPEAAATAGVE